MNKGVMFGPLTGRVGEIDLIDISAVGVVSESWGPNPREAKPEWVNEILEQCLTQGVRHIDEQWVSGRTI